MTDNSQVRLSLPQETINKLKSLAASENKTLSAYLADAASKFDYMFNSKLIARVIYIGAVKKDVDCYRIDIEFLTEDRVTKVYPLWYEIWASVEFIEDYMHYGGEPSKAEIADFAFALLAKRYLESENTLPKEFGLFCSNKTGIKICKSREELYSHFEKMGK